MGASTTGVGTSTDPRRNGEDGERALDAADEGGTPQSRASGRIK
jgi:hypothetical protein